MNQLAIPEKLYGREGHINMLLESFERISSGNGQVLLVPGTSGVGKTALVQELKVPIRERNGFFIKGKFEQYQQNIPYFAFRQALTELCRILQAGNEHEYVRFKEDILQSIGNLGQVLIDLVPEFESFIGPQPALGDISPQEARHRFAEVFRNFIKVICKPEHPLVLFIDDWQWADVASCELLRQLQVGNTLRYLLVIVSYRDNEVGSGHPLMTAVNDLRSHDYTIEVLRVNNITKMDVQAIVVDTLMPDIDNIDELATIIHEKTLGNPFFVRSFFSFLYEFNMIWFDNTGSQWKWNIHKPGGMDLPQNVIELFVLRLRQLDTESQLLLSLAACLGNRFDLETLSIISGHSSQKCQALLFSDLAKTMLLPFYRDGNNHPTEGRSVVVECTFLHDRVQQAAYTLIEPEELPNILLKIGRLLLTRLNPEQLDERLFEVMNDLNAGYHLIQENTEQVKMIELNITAARKAYHAAAYSSALQFYRAAHQFLKNSGLKKQLWIDRHELTMDLFKELAECEFLEGDRNEAENCIKESVAHSKTALEKAQALNILIVQYTLLARYPEAIASGRQALDALGISLPGENFEESRNQEIALVRQELGSRPVSTLAELPVMTNPEMLMASKILITMGPPCYRSHQRLWSVIVPKVVNLTLRYGNIPQVGYSHTAFGGLLGWVDNDYSTAKKFGELATHLMTHTFRSPSDQSVFYLMIGSSIRHWFKHLRYGTQDYTDAYETGLRSGNLQYAAYAFGHNMYCRFYQGVPLSGLIEETRHSLDFSKTRRNQWAIDLLEGGLNIFGQLSEEGEEGNLLVDNRNWSENEFLQRVFDHHNIQVSCIYKVLKTFSLLVSGNYEDALILSDETEPLIYTVGSQGLLPWPEHVFARILILTALYSKTNENQQTQWHGELDLMMNRLRIWAENCPDNFEHKYLLALAEIARIDGRSLEAIELYDKAIKATQADNFIQWEGIANERASGFWMECGNESLADVYWRQAYICYNRWGAKAKVYAMENEYRIRIAKNIPGIEGSGVTTTKQKQEIKNDLLDQQIKLLRNYELQMQQTKLLNEAKTHASELALATQRLRYEIAERKRTEDALRESEEFSRYILHTIPFGMDIVDENGIVLFQNENLEKYFGNEAIGNKCWCLYRDNKTQCPNCPLRAGINLGITEVYEATGVLGDRIFEITQTGMMFEGKKAMLEIFIDITERKRTEDALRESEEQFRSVLETVSLIGIMLDAEGRIILCNDYLLELTGWQRENVLQKSWFDLFLPIEIQKDIMVGVFQKSINDGKIVEHYENEIVTRLGERRLIAWNNTILHDHFGAVSGVASIGEDITERELAQAEIKLKNEELLKLNATKDKFFSIIAHDLRSPFSGFLGLTQIMAEDLPNLTMAQVHELAVSMSKSANNLNRLLENLLQWAQIQNGLIPFNLQAVQLKQNIETNIEMIQESAKNKGIEIKIAIPDEIEVFADSNMLQTIIRNLISNAMKFTGKGGKISILAKETSNNSVEISISDTGIGMSQFMVENLFRIDVKTNRKGIEGEPSTGLGLLLCKEFVEKHGGKLWVESEEGKGSVFYFTLPYNN